jgi:hypothetical protein
MASTITFQCYSCNQVLKVGSDKAGKKAKCIKCGTILTIPVSSEEEEIEEVRSGPPRKSSARDEEEDEDRPRKRRSRDDDDEEDEDRPRKRRSRDDDDEDDEDRPRKRRSRDDDDEDDEDRPRKRRSRDDDDDEDDEDRPRRRGRDRDDDDDEDDYDRPRRKKGGGGSPWPKVRVGLLLETINAFILIGHAGVMLLAFVLVLLALVARSAGMGEFSDVLTKIGVGLYVAFQFPAVAGYVFTIFTPNKKGAMALGITVLVLGCINLVLKILFFLVPLFGSTRGMGGGGLGGAGMMPSISAGSVAVAIMLIILIIILLDSEWIIYPLYLRAVSKQLKERWLEGGCIRALGFACGVIGAKLIMIIMTLTLARGNIGLGIIYTIVILSIIVYGVLLAFSILYVKVIQEVKSRID